MHSEQKTTSASVSEIASVFYKDLTGIYDWCHNASKKKESISEIDRYNFVLALYDDLRSYSDLLKERESGEEVSERVKILLKQAVKKIEKFESEKEKTKISQEEKLNEVLKNDGNSLVRKISDKFDRIQEDEDMQKENESFSEEEVLKHVVDKMSEEILIAKEEMENSKGVFQQFFQRFFPKK
jgi:hypothetical protein